MLAFKFSQFEMIRDFMILLYDILLKKGVFMDSILGILVVFLCFGFIIFVHELGHFLMARRVGIRVHEFALGFGPVLLSKKKGDTVYALRAFPFGGFVSMEGEDDKPCEDQEDKGNFQNKTYWEKIKVIACGPLMNYAVAILLFLIVGFAFGIGEMYLKPKVGKVLENTPAQAIGLQTGDLIVSIDSVPVMDGMALIEKIHASCGQELTIKVKRGEDFFTRKVTPVPMTKQGAYVAKPTDGATTADNPDLIKTADGKLIGVIGFQPDTKAMDMRFNKAAPGTIFIDTLDKTLKFSASPFLAVAFIVQGKMKAKDVAEGSAGPVGIGQMFFEMYKKGFPSLLYFIAMINILIGVFNLIPFPALDGARIAVIAFTGITKKAVDPNKEGMVHWVGFCILIVIVIFFTYNDIMRLIKGISFF